jgi:serine phosphatase RsbU (regulator of sigma subunit)
MGAVRLGELEWAVASRPAAGGAELGDACLVKPIEHGLLIAVVDGLGHGSEAALAARRAVTAMERSTQLLPAAIVVECHRALQATRGVVLGLAMVDARADSLTWIGVGDVRAVLWRAEPAGTARHDNMFTHNGVIGRSLPPLRPVTRSLHVGDTLIVTTDGIRAGFTPDPRASDSTERLASNLLERYAVPTDDALVLVARYRDGAA